MFIHFGQHLPDSCIAAERFHHATAFADLFEQLVQQLDCLLGTQHLRTKTVQTVIHHTLPRLRASLALVFTAHH